MTDYRVLVVDDEEDFLETLVERLRMRGLDTVGVASGERALEVMEEREFGVVVLDVGMPGMSGLEALVEIKKSFTGVQVILLSGHADVDLAVRGMDMGAFQYLVKPVPIDELVYRVEDAWKTRRLDEDGG